MKVESVNYEEIPVGTKLRHLQYNHVVLEVVGTEGPYYVMTARGRNFLVNKDIVGEHYERVDDDNS